MTEQSFERKIASGYEFNLIIDEDGHLYGFGNSMYGVFANGNSNYQINNEPILMDSYFNLQDDEYFRSIHAGENHAFAVTSDNRIFTWGHNLNGQTGVTHLMEIISSPIEITPNIGLEDGEDIKEWIQGDFHTIILTTKHRVLGWGNNQDINLGTNQFNIPITIGEYEAGPYVLAAADLTSYFDLESDETITSIGLNFALSSRNRIFGWGKTVEKIDDDQTIQDITELILLEDNENIEKLIDRGNFIQTTNNRYIISVRQTFPHISTVEYTEFHIQNEPAIVIEFLISKYGNSVIIDQDHQVWIFGPNDFANLGTGNTLLNLVTSMKRTLLRFLLPTYLMSGILTGLKMSILLILICH
jgi:alpha-tubulin suppressor-like RCC1 family protein